MEKVKITREQADLLDGILTNTNIDWVFMHLAEWQKVEKTTSEMAKLHHWYIEAPYLVSKAMIVGYEVEETPEDKVRELFQRERVNRIEGSLIAQYVQMGALEILKIYDIKIEGIN